MKQTEQFAAYARENAACGIDITNCENCESTKFTTRATSSREAYVDNMGTLRFTYPDRLTPRIEINCEVCGLEHHIWQFKKIDRNNR